MRYLLLAALIFGINLLPFLAPPTWVILVFYKLNSNLNTVVLIVIGVLAASMGRYFLARGTRLIRYRLKRETLNNLQAARSFLSGGKRKSLIYMLFFVISPLPSAQVFEAAGLVDAPLIPITLAFMFGRAISYSLSVAGASTLKAHGLNSIILDSLKSPWGIAIQLLCLVAIFLLTKIDWVKRFPA